MQKMLDRLKTAKKRNEEINQLLMEPATAKDIKLMSELGREQSTVGPLVVAYDSLLKIEQGISDAQLMLEEDDEELKEMAKMELEDLSSQRDEIISELELLLIPKDPNDGKNVIIEIRGAAGGDEANIFAGDLYRMYIKYAETQNWKINPLEVNVSDNGGYSLISFMLKGDIVYSKMKFESGAHRVQRVPKTESQGRVHTSTATVLVMPEADEVDIEISNNDLKIDTYRSSGAGGQSVNTTDSAVRITHLPTNTVVTCQDGRSQHENKAQALMVIRVKVQERLLEEAAAKEGVVRKAAIGGGSRSEKIRTYNYPQNRITDHRIGFTIQQLDRVMEGKMDDIIEALVAHEQQQKLAGEHHDN